MSTMQNETRLDVMLELPAHPTIRVVTILAVASESLFMYIIPLVTRETRDVCNRKSVIAMTGFTRRDRMKPKQWESR
jgi:hypothetical protein